MPLVETGTLSISGSKMEKGKQKEREKAAGTNRPVKKAPGSCHPRCHMARPGHEAGWKTPASIGRPLARPDIPLA